MNHRTSILTVAGLIVFATASAFADPNTFTQDYSYDWHTNGNWSYGHYPTSTEDALIPDGKTCIIGNVSAAALTVEVEASAVLGVDYGQTLTIYGANSMGTVDSLTVDGTLYLRQFLPDLLGTLRFYTPKGDNMYPQLVGDGTVTAATAAGYGAGRIEKHPDDTSIVCLEIGDTVTVKGNLEFNKLSVYLDDDATLLADDIDCMTVLTAPGCITVDGGGTFRVDGEYARMSFLHTDFQASGTLDVTDGLMEIDPGFCAPPSLSDGTLTIDGGTFTCESRISFTDSAITIDGSGEMEITVDLDMRTETLASSLTLEDGTLSVTGEMGIRDTTVTVKAGWVLAAEVDSRDSAITIQGGDFRVVGTFLADQFSEESSITVSGGELELNGDYTGTDTAFTISGGLLDINDDFSNAGGLSYTGGTITVAENKTATFE